MELDYETKKGRLWGTIFVVVIIGKNTREAKEQYTCGRGYPYRDLKNRVRGNFTKNESLKLEKIESCKRE